MGAWGGTVGSWEELWGERGVEERSGAGMGEQRGCRGLGEQGEL